MIFDLQNSENVVFLCINAIKHVSRDKAYVGNLSKGLVSVAESYREREKVKAITSTRHCVSDALIFDLQNSENVVFCV